MSIENGCDYYYSCDDCAKADCLVNKQKAEIERLTKEKTESAKTAVEVLEQNIELQKQVDELKDKEIPKKVKCHIKLPKNRIAGYCPTCGCTVDIKLTWLIKHKGHRCSWCGQAIDLTDVEVE